MLKDWIFKWWIVIASVYQINFFQNAAWEAGSNTDKLCVIFLKKRYKISDIPAKKPKSLKKFIEVHFSRSKIFLLFFYDVLWRQSVRKKVRQKYSLLTILTWKNLRALLNSVQNFIEFKVSCFWRFSYVYTIN